LLKFLKTNKLFVFIIYRLMLILGLILIIWF
jgi:hypothetical protein